MAPPKPNQNSPPNPPTYTQQQVTAMMTAILEQVADRIIASNCEQPHPLTMISHIHFQLRDRSIASTFKGFSVTYSEHNQQRFPIPGRNRDVIEEEFYTWLRSVPQEGRDGMLDAMRVARERLGVGENRNASAQQSAGSQEPNAKTSIQGTRPESSRDAQKRANRKVDEPSLLDGENEELDLDREIALTMQEEEYEKEPPESSATNHADFVSGSAVPEESEEVLAKRQKEEERKARNKKPIVNESTNADNLVPQPPRGNPSKAPQRYAKTETTSSQPNTQGSKPSKQKPKSQSPPSKDDTISVARRPNRSSGCSEKAGKKAASSAGSSKASTMSSDGATSKKPSKKRPATKDTSPTKPKKHRHRKDKSEGDSGYNPEAEAEADESGSQQGDAMPPSTSRQAGVQHPLSEPRGSGHDTPGPGSKSQDGKKGNRGNKPDSTGPTEQRDSTPQRSLRNSIVDPTAAAAATRTIPEEDPDPERKRYRGWMNTMRKVKVEEKKVFETDPEEILHPKKRRDTLPVETEPTSDRSGDDAATTPRPANADSLKGSKTTNKGKAEDDVSSERSAAKVNKAKKPAPGSDQDDTGDESDKAITIDSKIDASEPETEDELDDQPNPENFDQYGSSSDAPVPSDQFDQPSPEDPDQDGSSSEAPVPSDQFDQSIPDNSEGEWPPVSNASGGTRTSRLTSPADNMKKQERKRKSPSTYFGFEDSSDGSEPTSKKIRRKEEKGRKKKANGKKRRDEDGGYSSMDLCV